MECMVFRPGTGLSDCVSPVKVVTDLRLCNMASSVAAWYVRGEGFT